MQISFAVTSLQEHILFILKVIMILISSKWLINVLFIQGFLLVFRWGWHLKYEHSSIPQNELFHKEEGYMIFQPFLTRHIMHFAESVNHLLNKLRNRSDYPPVGIYLMYYCFS